jgi:hypothetical protein
MEYKPDNLTQSVAVIYQNKAYIVDNYGLWLLAYKETYPTIESIKIINRKIYYNTYQVKSLNSELYEATSKIIQYVNNDQDHFSCKIICKNKTSHLNIFENTLKLLDVDWKLKEDTESRIYILNITKDKKLSGKKKLEEILICKEILDSIQELKLLNPSYFELNDLQKKCVYAFRFSTKDKTVIYLIYASTVFNDFIYIVGYNNGIILQDINNFFDSKVIVKYLSSAPKYEILFLNEVFGSDVQTYYTDYHYTDKYLRYFESRVKFTSYFPNLKLLCFKNNTFWYCTSVNDYIIYFSLSYGKRILLHYIGFEPKYRNKVKDYIIEKELSPYIDSIFFNKLKRNYFVGNESQLLRHLT